MMAQTVPIKLIFTQKEKPVAVESSKVTITTNKDKLHIDDAYKEFFASLFKIKDKDVQRRVLQAVNGQNVTCASCANKIQTKGSPVFRKTVPSSFSFATQTMAKDFEFLEKINRSPKQNAINSSSDNSECYLLNKIQLRRAKRSFEPYAVKTEKEKCVIPSIKANYLRYNYEPGSLLNKIRKPTTKPEYPPVHTIPRNYSITEQLLFDNFIDQSMSPQGFLKESNDEPTKINNDFFFLSTMEEEIRTAGVRNEEGLYTIHMATINDDLFKLRRLMVIYKYNKWDVNIPSEDGKKETALHYAMSCTNNVHNNEIINLLYDNGADVLAINDVSDTVLHLAAETVDDYAIITKLLSKISLDDLSERNDKSQTILHIAAANKNRTFVKSILNFIDKKLNIPSIGNDIPFTKAKEYFEQLDTIHLNYVKTFINENFKKPTINPIKAKILNEQDGRSGKTAIFLSLEVDDRSICQSTSLMLLAHLVDTRIQDFGNTSCAYYSTEILRNRIIAQAIYNADSMHNAVVFKTLKQTERHRSSESRKRTGSQSLCNLPTDKRHDGDDGSDIMSKVAKVLS